MNASLHASGESDPAMRDIWVGDGQPARSRWACVMAGGLGRRFWPLSRRTRPKHLMPVVGTQPLLRQTAERIVPQVGWEHLLVVTTTEQAAMVQRMLPELPPDRIIAEPLGRNTAACVGLALRWLMIRGEEASLVGFFPSDHVIGDLDAFHACVARGWRTALTDRVVAFGIAPTCPETGYGYIRAGALLHDTIGPRVFAVRGFYEKPDRATAEEWTASGEFYWNSGMFVACVGLLWTELERYLPEMTRILCELGTNFSLDGLLTHRSRYSSLPSVSLDQGVMEKSDRLAVIESSFDWDDVGSWDAASRYWPEKENGCRILGDDAVLVDCTGCRVRTDGLLVALVGVRDLVVVQTPDAILICPRDRTQDVKALVENLETRDATQYL